jgi:RNA polymerase sigma-70 factor (ECF subfamily)
VRDNDTDKIVAAIRRGDSDAFAAFYHDYAGSIIKLLTRVLGNRADAEEVTQDAFAWLWENRETLDPHTSLKGYAAGTARNMAFRLLRRRRTIRSKHEDIKFTLAEQSDSTDSELISQETEILIRDAIRNMPPKRRQIFEMHRDEGLTYKEIADRMGISYNTVKFHMQAALADIRAVLVGVLIMLLFR